MKSHLAVFNTQPPHLYFGGVESRIIEMVKRFKNDADINVYSGTKGGFRKPFALEGGWVVPCYCTDVAFPVDNWFFNRTISRAANIIKADVYESHAVSGYGFLRALRKRGVRVPFIETVHGVLADEYLQAMQSGGLSPRERLNNFFMGQLAGLEGETARNADLVVTVSNHSLKQIMQLYSVDEKKIRVVPNGVDKEKFKPTPADDKAKKRWGLGNKEVVLFVGRLIPRKGLQYLVEAAKSIVKEKPETIFVIIGAGPLRNQLTVTLRKINLSRHFVFLGDVDNEVLPSLYGLADVFVLPSIQEGQGIALLEAQASAKPVVAFSVSGVKEAVADGKSGVLVERGNSAMLSNAVLELLSNRALREKMGSLGRDFVLRNFTWDICAQKMLAVYHEALGVI